MARPDPYTPELAATILARLAKGESLRAICRDADMPSRPTVHKWIIEDTDGFATQYTRARDAGLDEIADEVFEIADDGTNDYVQTAEGQKLNGEHVQRSRLRFDARRWYLSKLAPKKYGERLATEISGPDGGPVKIEDGTAPAKLAAILAAAQERKELA